MLDDFDNFSRVTSYDTESERVESWKSESKRTTDEGGRTPFYEPDEFESDFELDIELIEDFRLCRRRESYPYPGWLFIPFI